MLKTMFETLESRQLMSATLTHEGTLQITGTDNDDVIVVSRSGESIIVEEGGTPHKFARGDVKRINATLGGGDDRFSVKGQVYVRMNIEGGAGDDQIRGGLGNDIIKGGSGDDAISGSAGDDQLYGEAGNDVLGGDMGCDNLNGGSGTDILVAIDRRDRNDVMRLPDGPLPSPDATHECADSVTADGDGGVDQVYCSDRDTVSSRGDNMHHTAPARAPHHRHEPSTPATEENKK